jgi:putative NIF3 family GTP cyclohydrolase 1 type 2
LALAKIALAPGAEVKTGFGRYRKLAAPTTLAETIQRVKAGTGVKAVRVAVPPHLVGTAHEAITIKDLAVCAGSGTSVFRALKRITPDLLLSGEMGHHDVLGAVQNGSIVILCEHTNSERGYLRDRLQPYLKAELPADVTVVCSEVDADPLVSF